MSYLLYLNSNRPTFLPQIGPDMLTHQRMARAFSRAGVGLGAKSTAVAPWGRTTPAGSAAGTPSWLAENNTATAAILLRDTGHSNGQHARAVGEERRVLTKKFPAPESRWSLRL